MTDAPRRPRTILLDLAWVLSLPERALRAAAAGIAGLLTLLSGLLPRFIRRSRFYRGAVERQIRFLAEAVGGVHAAGAPLPSGTGARMAVGSVVDNLAIVTLHVSPVWLLLALSDVVAGAGHITRELLRELEKEKILPAGAGIASLDEALHAVSRASGTVAETINLPPLSVAALRRAAADVRANLAGVDVRGAVGVEDLERLLSELRAAADAEGRSILAVSGGVAGFALARARALVRGVTLGALAGARTGGRILFRELVLSYADDLAEVRRRGLARALREAAAPWAQAGVSNFDGRRVTWTEIALSFGRLGRAPWRAR